MKFTVTFGQFNASLLNNEWISLADSRLLIICVNDPLQIVWLTGDLTNRITETDIFVWQTNQTGE